MSCPISEDAVWKMLTALIAFGTLVVAVQQWLISQHKLKLDLFEKRMEIVEALRIFLSKASNIRIEESDLNEYRLSIFEAQFLFDKEMYEYLLNVWERGLDLKALELKSSKEGNAEKWSQQVRDFSNELKSIGNRFEPYMAFGKAGASN